MKKFLCLLFMLIPALSFAQGDIVLSDKRVTQEQIDLAAKNLQQLKTLQQNDTTMEVGTFAVVKREDTLKSDLLWQFTDFTKKSVTYGTCALLIRHEEPANTAVRIHMRRAGDTEAKVHEFPPQPAPWTWLEAAQGGEVTLAALASSEAGKQPVLVSNTKITIIGKKPPGPIPDVDPVPDNVKYTGLRVVIVYEQESAMTREQTATIRSPKIREWLDKNCVKDSKGKPSHRTWDKDIVIADTEDKAMARLWSDAKPKLGPLPQLIIVTDQKGVTIPLPDTEQATLDELAKYGAK